MKRTQQRYALPSSVSLRKEKLGRVGLGKVGKEKYGIGYGLVALRRTLQTDEMTFLDKNSERPRVVAPKRGFYSEAVSNNPLIVEDADAAQAALGATPKRAKLAWQVRTELYAPVIARVAPAPPKERRKPAKDLWVAAEDRWGNVIPAELWGPALPTAEEAQDRAVTRSVSIERHMRQYANVNVRDLLTDVPPELLDPPPPPAPLAGLYDSATTWEEWLELGKVGEEQRPVPVEAYVPAGAGPEAGPGGQGYRWVDAGAVNFDPKQRLWTVLDAGKRELFLPRLYVRFRAEDPVLFAQRLKEAAQMREECEVALRFLFEGVEIALKAAAAVFITMNPGYAGRTELPDNLKALFRPVAMMVPNYTLIAEISLFSFGFSNARELANKITTTFKLSSEQLTVKTVIAVAGNLKREKPEMGEPQIALRAIRDVNVPKFLRDDLKLFNGIVSDLFPRLQEEEMDYGVLVDAIRGVCVQKGLQPVEEFILKVLQLYDTTV
ncbi:hypothetical protein FOCC_FOCC013409, partial [Frankliniella occidentalis]